MSEEKLTVDAPESRLHTVREGIRDAVDDASNAARRTHSAIGRIASRTVYHAVYGVSFGVVFTGLLVGKLIPKNGVLEAGLHDGAAAARKVIDKPPVHTEERVEEIIDSTAMPA